MSSDAALDSLGTRASSDADSRALARSCAIFLGSWPLYSVGVTTETVSALIVAVRQPTTAASAIRSFVSPLDARPPYVRGYSRTSRARVAPPRKSATVEATPNQTCALSPSARFGGAPSFTSRPEESPRANPQVRRSGSTAKRIDDHSTSWQRAESDAENLSTTSASRKFFLDSHMCADIVRPITTM